MTLLQMMDRLAAFEPTPFPVVSLYLNTQPDQHGSANFEPFVRKELSAVAKTYPLRSDERKSFERDMDRIYRFLRDELRASTNGVAIFACAAAGDFFEAVQLDAPIEEHRLYVYHQPHLYPLARVMGQYRRYAVLVADTNNARLFVFAMGTTRHKRLVSGIKASRTSVGGWSQARYQRHTENYYMHHAKEVVDVLDSMVRREKIDSIILAGDEVIVPLLQEQFPKHIAEKIIDVMRLDITTPEHEIFSVTLEALREQDARDEKTKVQRLLDAYRSGGLGVVGSHDTLVALTNGQADELIISSSLEEVHSGEEEVGAALAPKAPVTEGALKGASRRVLMADALVTRARQTGAGISFIEDATLLTNVGGVGAMLRYR